MKHKMSIKLRDNSDEFFEADKVELLPFVLSVICGSVNTCFPLHRIAFYRVEDVEDDA